MRLQVGSLLLTNHAVDAVKLRGEKIMSRRLIHRWWRASESLDWRRMVFPGLIQNASLHLRSWIGAILGRGNAAEETN